MTAPIVVDQTTRERSRPRLAGAARSVAAKRDWSPPAAAAPISPSPTNSSTTLPADIPSTQTTAPAAAINAAVLSETRRPLRSAN